MTKIQELQEFLTEIQSSVTKKVQREREILAQTEKDQKANSKPIQHLHEYCEIVQYSEGQLYEINYILGKFWEIISKD